MCLCMSQILVAVNIQFPLYVIYAMSEILWDHDKNVLCHGNRVIIQ